MRRALWPAVLLAAACSSAGGPELVGDRAYGAGRYAEAMARYREAARRRADGRLWAKIGAAALHLGDLKAAAEAYRQLAAEDPSRADEAADGLETVARGAERRDDPAALHDAVVALRAIAPERSVARYALALVRRSAVPPEDALTILPAAMAAAPDPAAMDSLLAAYGAALQRSGGCDRAAPAYRAALRRSRSPAVRAAAAPGLAACALSLGLGALGQGRADEAAAWFRQAVSVDSTSWIGRRALIGLGDARVGQGDVIGAAIAFQSAVVEGQTPDSITRLAEDRLRALGAPPVDSARHRLP